MKDWSSDPLLWSRSVTQSTAMAMKFKVLMGSGNMENCGEMRWQSYAVESSGKVQKRKVQKWLSQAKLIQEKQRWSVVTQRSGIAPICIA